MNSDFLEDFDFDYKSRDNNYNKESKSKNNYNKYKKSYKSKSNSDKITIGGGYKLDIWSKEVKIPTVAYNPEEVNTDKKYFTFCLANRTMELNDDVKSLIEKVTSKLKSEGYKLRVICDYMGDAKKVIMDAMGYNIYYITPWKKYCNLNIKYSIYMPTDDNIKLAANYYKNYHKLPGAIRALLASVVTTVFGLHNNEPSKFIIVYDPYYNGNDIDFNKSKDSSNYYLLAKRLGLTIINLANKKDVELFKKLV